MKKIAYGLLMVVICATNSTNAQQKNKWVYLFNGKSVAELRGYKMDSFPSARKVEDGGLIAQPDIPNVDLVTRETYTNFDLTLKWKVSKAGNSGIFYNVQENASHQSGN